MPEYRQAAGQAGAGPALPGDVGAWDVRVGFAIREIPVDPGSELSGYPFVERRAAGSHDPLLAAAMVIDDGETAIALVSLDLIAVGADLVRRCRERIAAECGICPGHVMIAATHTHSGPPVRLGPLFDDGVVGTPDCAFEAMVEAAVAGAVAAAVAAARPCRLAMGWCAAEPPVGGNRRDPAGATDPLVPLVAAFDGAGQLAGAALAVACHPTVLQADNLLASGDLMWGIRASLDRRLGRPVPVLGFTSAAGDQSTRTTRLATTFDEAARLGDRVAAAVAGALPRLADLPADPRPARVRAAVLMVDVPLRDLPPLADALEAHAAAESRLADLRRRGVDPVEIRTAEVTNFGAKHTVRYARQASVHPFPETVRGEIQALSIGEIAFVGLPAELFAELGLRLRDGLATPPMVVAYANDLIGYAPTRAAFREGGYEPAVTLLGEPAGELLVDAARDLLASAHRGGGSGQ